MQFKSTKKTKPSDLKVGLCAPAGYGKTFQVKMLPYEKEQEVLIITTEHGNECLRDKDFAVAEVEPRKNPLTQLKDIITFLYKENGFKWIVLDSFTDFAEKLLAWYNKHPDEFTTKSGAVDKLKMYGRLKDDVLAVNAAFLGIPDCSKLAIFGAMEKEDGPDTKIVLNIPGSAKDVISFAFDEFYFIKVTKTDDGTKRELVTNNDGLYEAKSRMSGAAKKPLDLYEPADLGAVIRKAYGSK